MCFLVRQSDGQQYMGRIQGSGSTCRTAGCADTFHIQHDQKGLSLDEFKADVAVVRQTFYRIAVQTAVRNLG